MEGSLILWAEKHCPALSAVHIPGVDNLKGGLPQLPSPGPRALCFSFLGFTSVAVETQVFKDKVVSDSVIPTLLKAIN